jgi:predicted O-methyltransferase YrrM
VRRLARHPGWLKEYWRVSRDWRRTRAEEFDLGLYQHYFSSAATAVEALTGAPPGAYGAARQRFSTPSLDRQEPLAEWAAGPSLQELVGVVVRLTKPEVVLETGVAMGVSSAVILEGMEDNGRGHLFSLDLPGLPANAQALTGRAVPAHLRLRWSLSLGPSRQLLPELARAKGPIDLSVHDADHSYRGQLEEYRTVWPYLRPGGILISDDVCNPAFIDFAAGVREQPYLVPEEGDSCAVGLLAKPRGRTRPTR